MIDKNFVSKKPKTGICSGFEEECNNTGKLYRQRTNYQNEEENWVVLCSKCRKLNDDYWDDRWEHFFSMQRQ